MTDGPGSWACLDWRFMLPVPDLGAVWVAPDCPEEAAALRALGLPVAADGGTSDTVVADTVVADTVAADTVVALGATADLSALAARLGGTGMVKLTVTGRPPQAGLFGVVRPWRAWRRRLRSVGLDVILEAIGLPNAQRTTTMVDLGQPLALRLALRRQPASRKGRVLGRVAEVAVRMGMRQLVCRQGVVVAVVRGGGAR